MFSKTNTELTDVSNRLSWTKSSYGQDYLKSEAQYLQSALRQMGGPTVLQMGSAISPSIQEQLDYPLQLLVRSINIETLLQEKSSNHLTQSQCINADAAFLPIVEESIASLILPHVLETHALPHQVLREVHRVLIPGGCLVLTGFNPLSLLSIQRYIYPKIAYKGHYYSLKRVKDWLQLLGFEVTGSAMFQYAPLAKSGRVRKASSFLEAVGDRWLPMFGGGYMIIAKKRDLGVTLTSKVKFQKAKISLGNAAVKSPISNHKYKYK